MRRLILKTFTDEEKIQMLADIVAMKTVNENEIEVAEYLKDLFADYGIKSTIIPVTDTRVNLVAEIGSGDPVIGLSGHMDVVSIDNASKWSFDPFTLTEEGGKLYGRGTDDMKAGLLNLILTMIELKEKDELKNGTIRLLATTGEEVGAAGSKKLYEEGYMKDVDYLLIPEPSNDTIIYAHKGSLNMTITSHGQAAHSSMPSEGYNAINPLMAYLLELDEELNQHPTKNEILGELVMNTTIFNAGEQINTLPSKAVAELNIRTIPEFANDAVIQLFKETADKFNDEGADLEVEVTMSLPSVYGDKESRLVKSAQEIAEKHLDFDIAIDSMPGVTDAANLLQDKDNDFPLIILGPGETKMAHQPDEYVYKDYYFAFFDIYKELIIELTRD